MAIDWDNTFDVNEGVLIDGESAGIGEDGGRLIFKDYENSETDLTTLLTGFDVDRILFNQDGEFLISQDFNILIGV